LADQHPLGGSPIVRAAMRRNRWRLLVLALVSIVNAFAVYTALAGTAAVLVLLGFPSLIDHSWSPALRTDVMLAVVVGFVVVLVVARDTLHDLPASVSSGLGVRPVTDAERVPELLEELSIATGLPSPAEVGVIESVAPNALAVGVGARRTSIILTTGLFGLLTRDELEAVLATEMIAAARLDVALRSVVAALAHRGRSDFAEWVPTAHWANPLFLLWSVAFAPMQLLTFVLWRSTLVSNGLQSDDLAIAVTRNPEALLHALQKLRQDQHQLQRVPPVSVPLWVEPEGVVGRSPSPFKRLSGTSVLDTRIAHLAARCGEPGPSS
jgi:Zn-dependent protease with chaperone function